MSKRRGSAHRPRGAERPASRRGWLSLAALGSVAALAAAALLLQSIAAPDGTSRAAAVPDHVKGAADAPVTIVEWGDFQ
jgi:hypothetical protein